MPEPASNPPPRFVLAPPPSPVPVVERDDQALSDAVLRRNAMWFIRLRWLVVGILLFLAALSAMGVTARFCVSLDAGWLAGVAMFLGLANAGYGWHCRGFSEDRPLGVRANLWTQIVLDLAAVTLVVHFVGPTLNHAPFLYVIHIILACIFFPTLSSSLVLALSSLLFSGYVLIEHAGLVDTHQLFGNCARVELPAHVKLFQVSSAILLWTAIWFLVARLSTVLRQRERRLVEARREALATFATSQQHLRHTAHQLKAPLEAIRSSLSLLRDGYAGELPEASAAILRRVDVRAAAASDLVYDILTLASLKAGDAVARDLQAVNLRELVEKGVSAVTPTAQARRIRIRSQLGELVCRGNRQTLEMLIDNLLSNAVNYSREGGEVEVSMTAATAETAAQIVIRDHGIGIPADKLGKVFEEYYRTPEAKKHNPHSTGVGMAIVRQVAAMHRITVEISSEVGVGTQVTLLLPSGPEAI